MSVVELVEYDRIRREQLLLLVYHSTPSSPGTQFFSLSKHNQILCLIIPAIFIQQLAAKILNSEIGTDIHVDKYGISSVNS